MQLTTLSPPAIVGDAWIVLLLWYATGNWVADDALKAMYALAAWMFFTKFIKLITHFVRFPIDILLFPLSPLFGWLHGVIKCYALVTLSEVSIFIPKLTSDLRQGFRQHGVAVQVQMPVTVRE